MNPEIAEITDCREILGIAFGYEASEAAALGFAATHDLEEYQAYEILGTDVSMWEDVHRRAPQPLTLDALLSEAAKGMAEAMEDDSAYYLESVAHYSPA